MIMPRKEGAGALPRLRALELRCAGVDMLGPLQAPSLTLLKISHWATDCSDLQWIADLPVLTDVQRNNWDFQPLPVGVIKSRHLTRLALLSLSPSRYKYMPSGSFLSQLRQMELSDRVLNTIPRALVEAITMAG